MPNSKYSLYGSPDFDQRVDADMEKIVKAIQKDPEGSHVKAIVLLGGYGRGEGTPLSVNGVEMPFNDYDLVVVSSHYSRGFTQRIRQLEPLLTEQLGIPVDLYPHTFYTLKRAERSLLNYEMQRGHRVIWGSSKVLSMMPEISLKNLSLSEGTRLLMNRGKLLLDMDCRLSSSVALSDEEAIHFRKFLWKNHLAFGDCLLLANNAYDVLYQVKEKVIDKFRATEQVPEVDWMISAYRRAIAFKQKGDLEILNGTALMEEWRYTKEYWLKFFLWFESMRLGVSLRSSEDYCEKIALKETKQLTSLLRNFRLLGSRMAYPSVDWVWIHPRNRLYAALHLLLRGCTNEEMLTSLLGAEGGMQSWIQQFYAMRLRLS